MTTTPLLKVVSLVKHYPVRLGLLGKKKLLRAVDDVSLFVERGETVSLVGESGCGKSTVGRSILRFINVTSGEISLDGTRIEAMSAGEIRPLRQKMQMIFQDPFSSLNPRLKVRDILAEPITNFGIEVGHQAVNARIKELLERVRLPSDALTRYPHEFSGGQRQRIGIARALAPGAALLVCDEAVSALDVSVKAQIVNLLAELQDQLGLALLFISHDLAIVEHLSHRIAVMYLGKIVETADRRSIFAEPRHPYTRALLSAVPVAEPRAKRTRIVLRGEIPSAVNPPPGCRFHTRCPFVFDRCRVEEPLLRPTGATGHRTACHLDEVPDYTEVLARSTAPPRTAAEIKRHS